MHFTNFLGDSACSFINWYEMNESIGHLSTYWRHIHADQHGCWWIPIITCYMRAIFDFYSKRRCLFVSMLFPCWLSHLEVRDDESKMAYISPVFNNQMRRKDSWLKLRLPTKVVDFIICTLWQKFCKFECTFMFLNWICFESILYYLFHAFNFWHLKNVDIK